MYTEEEKKKIINVFMTSQEQEEIQHKLQNISGQKMSLLLTQPWYDDKVMSEYMHREFYKHIIDKYVKYPIIIKPHPRDKQNYECLYPDAIVLKQTYVPCEILGFISNIEVEQAVTHCSTAIHGITYAKEKIFLGVDYMVPFLKRDTDFVQTSLLAKELMADNDDKPEME